MWSRGLVAGVFGKIFERGYRQGLGHAVTGVGIELALMDFLYVGISLHDFAISHPLNFLVFILLF